MHRPQQSWHTVSLVLTIFTDITHRPQHSRHTVSLVLTIFTDITHRPQHSKHTVSLVFTILTDVMHRLQQRDTLSPFYLPSLLMSGTAHNREQTHCLPCTYHPYWHHALATTESRHIEWWWRGPSCSWGCRCDAVCSPPRRSRTTMAALHWRAVQHIIQVNATVPTWSIMYHNYWWCFTGCLLTLQSSPNPSHSTVTDGVSLYACTTHHSG